MVLLVLIGICLFVGLLLYLPFFLWFRHRRRHGRPVGEAMRFTGAGYVVIAVEVTIFVGGTVAGVVAPGSWLGSVTHGGAGMLRWMACLAVLPILIDMVLRRAGVALQRPSASAAAPIPERAGPPRLRWKIATLRGVPLFIHGSLPVGGLLVAGVANAGALEFIGYGLSFVALVVLHELGHFAAARTLGLRVYSIEISGHGGSCRTQLPRSVKQTFVLFSGGLAGQAALLLLTLATVAILGTPHSAVGRSVFITFTVVNLVVAVINLVPGKINDDLSTDGAVLWDLFLHVFAGKPHPMAQQHALSPVFSPETRLSEIDGMVPPGFRVGVELLNDDSTPMEFVVAMLEKHMKLDRKTAIASMIHVHGTGGFLFALNDHDQAAKVAEAIALDAREQGHPLVCRAVEAQMP